MARTAEHAQLPGVLNERIEACLGESLPPAGDDRLLAAMHYALTGGGKHLRPLLVYNAGLMAGAPLERLDPVAVAVEMIHAYSLIHDDLPAMDDDDLRRGRATCHLAFDEATAILAGDALQAEAFRRLASLDHPDPARPAAMVRCLAEAAGPHGMAGGQAMDLALTGRQTDPQALETLHRLKTGALIRASLQLGAMAADREQTRLGHTLGSIGDAIGLAFQIQDDVLDVIGDTDTLGKPRGADEARQKPTFASLLGIDTATGQYQALYSEALGQLEGLPEAADGLRQLIMQMRDRRS